MVCSCYGSELYPEFEDRLMGISVAPKILTLIFQIIDFCKVMGQGLCLWTEQTWESVHQDFKEIWKKYKVNDTDRETYGENLLKSVSTSNSQHL